MILCTTAPLLHKVTSGPLKAKHDCSHTLASELVIQRHSVQCVIEYQGQPITGHTHTHSLTQSHTTGNLETPISLEACLWIVGGNRSIWRKPTKHGEKMQTPHTQ
ncbi:hypothetical protein QTP70_013815 [Hemibagrus guttatus]|uniref:Uncharacterized protein n=1 Tax=Hemibagrus guttatus TaxID=175788 RepID=A0AAE0RDE5_9TELE|nr:hypothetical protein QTP70_013815 [Hemibagrus guttatus]